MTDQNRLPLVIAHRGFSARYLENTLPAIESAIQLGVDFVEIDVHETCDGQIAVFHDYRLNRICGVRGRVRDKPMAELKRLNPAIPTLAEVLRLCRGKTKLLIEIKRAAPRKVVALIKGYRMQSAVTLFSLRGARLQELAEVQPQSLRWVIITGNLRWAIRKLGDGIEGLALGRRLVTSRAIVERIHGGGWKLFVWTVNRETEMRRLIDWGVDGLITDHPDRALRLRDGG